MGETINITALDCLPFNEKEASADVISFFIKECQDSIFWFKPVFAKDQDDSRLAEYDYKNHQWRAGHFIGEASFNFRGNHYKVSIKPRFGEDVLLRMLEQIFNIRITPSQSDTNTNSNWQHFIKRIIAVIWIQHLANANLHGVPKRTIKKKYKGIQVRGRIDVRKSIIPMKTSNEVVSYSYEKAIDESILSIINEAYHILKSDFDLGTSGLNLPDSAQDALNHIFEVKIPRKLITYNQYIKIRYKEIYKSWKPLVDLSWDIIQQKAQSLRQENKKKGLGFFLDMAEIWEQYLRSLLSKNLHPLGWYLKKQNIVAYDGYFFKRNLIPDLIFEKENEVMVWDAKYKRMKADYKDVDRADFFQIHTYLLTQVNKKVRIGGLFYPLTTNYAYSENSFRSPYLINQEGLKIKFAIEGIEFKEDIGLDCFREKETEFVNRIKQDIL